MSAATIFKKIGFAALSGVSFYCLILALMSNAWVQRQSLYAHRMRFGWLPNYDASEKYGFCKNQVTQFWITTPDGHRLNSWHILPIGLYGEHEDALIKDRDGPSADIRKTLNFKLLRSDPEARLVINFHGNAGTLVQGWRTDTYRMLSAADPNKIHVLAFDYRGFGRSKGVPNEEALLQDAVAVVTWVLDVAEIPPERIILIGQSLGTAVVAAVAKHFILEAPKVEFAGIILVAGFSDIPNLLRTYAIGGVVPILYPLKWYPNLQLWLGKRFYDTWESADRIETLAKHSKRLRLTLVHAANDRDIRSLHSDALFHAAVKGHNSLHLSSEDIDKAKTIVDLGKEGRMIAWEDGDSVDIRQYMTTYGGHNRITTSSWVPLAIRRTFKIQ